jgi:ABC-2 type transport system ATP-binding protein
LMVAKAMVHTPPILVLDEPTAGVDVELRRLLWDHVRELNAKGVTIVLTTHYLEEAEELCDRIAIIDQGQIVACEDKSQLLSRIDSKKVVISIKEKIASLPVGLNSFAPTLGHDEDNTTQLSFSYRRSDSPISAILAAVNEAGLTIVDISTEESDLEDIFLQLTSHPKT